MANDYYDDIFNNNTQKNGEDGKDPKNSESTYNEKDPFSTDGRLNSENAKDIPVINSGRDLSDGPFPNQRCFSKDSFAVNNESSNFPGAFSPFNNKNNNDKNNKNNTTSGLNTKKMGIFLALCVIFSFLASILGNMVINELGLGKNSININGKGTASNEAYNSNASNASSDLISKIADSVVEIRTSSAKQTNPFSFIENGEIVTEYCGSGVILSEDGKIITNNHVIDKAEKIMVKTRDGKEYEAKKIGTDSVTDVALIKIDATGLPYASLGDSSKINIGDMAIVVGNPLGNGGTVTTGIISAKDRKLMIQKGGGERTLIQTDAAINPGNSGGGLFNAYGELIGIVVCKASENAANNVSIEGLGFAIPINEIGEIIKDIESNGHVTGRAGLGIRIIEIKEAAALYKYNVDRYGVYIQDITDGSCAHKAGLKRGDLIRAIDDKSVDEAIDVTNILNEHRAGDKVIVTVDRNGTQQHLEVILDEKKG